MYSRSTSIMKLTVPPYNPRFLLALDIAKGKGIHPLNHLGMTELPFDMLFSQVRDDILLF